MVTPVTIPALGESATEGTATTWLKQVGDTVELDEPTVEVSMGKVDSEVPPSVAGILLEILIPGDETVEVGTEIARIDDVSEVSVALVTAPVDAPVEAPAAPTAAPAETAAAPASAPAQGTGVCMPALGEPVTEGTVTTWLKSVGDVINADEPFLGIPADKVDLKIPSPVAGFLAETRVPEDETVEIGTVIMITSSSAPSAAPVAETATPAAPVAPAAPAAPATPVVPAVPVDPFPNTLTLAQTASATPVVETPVTVTGSIYVTLIVCKLTCELGVDLASVPDMGVGDRVRREDIEAAVAAVRAAVVAPAVPATSTVPAAAQANAVREPSPLRGTARKMSRLRQTITYRMVKSLQTMTQLTTVIEIDVTKVAVLRVCSKDAFPARHGTKLMFPPFFVEAATEALTYHPKVNVTINDKEIAYFDYEHVDTVVDTPRGLLVPVIKNAGDKDIMGVAALINDLAARTRESKIGPGELSDSMFTVTDAGSGDALSDTLILNMPETTTMGVDTVVKRPVVTKGAGSADVTTIRSMVYLSLSYDCRLVDGASTSRFPVDVKRRLEEGALETDLGL